VNEFKAKWHTDNLESQSKKASSVAAALGAHGAALGWGRVRRFAQGCVAPPTKEKPPRPTGGAPLTCKNSPKTPSTSKLKTSTYELNFKMTGCW
jgi:hypothetical protein